MNAAANAGWLGGLAVGFGLGAAVLAGAADASAQPSESGSASAHSPSTGSTAKSAKALKASKTRAASRPATSGSSRGGSRTAQAGVVVSTGGARSSVARPVGDRTPTTGVQRRLSAQPTVAEVSAKTTANAASTTADTGAPTATDTTAPAAAVASTARTAKVGWVTGPNNNTAQRFGIAGTDLGIMWDNGYDDTATTTHQVLMIFGDTFSGANMTGSWRSNVLLRTSDPIARTFEAGSATDPFAGSPLSASSGLSKQVIAGSRRYLGLFGSEVTIIPTAAISVQSADSATGVRQYVNFMSVRSWDLPGTWTTNYSAIAYSDDNGQTWSVAPQTIRAASWLRSSTRFVYGNQNFQQGAFVKPPADAPDAGYVYSFGTPSGRIGSAYVSRVDEADLLDLSAYEYWDGSTWVPDKPSAAVPILPPTSRSQNAGGFLGQLGLFFGGWVASVFGVGGPSGHVSEMSVQYNDYLDKYVAMYSDGLGRVVMRTADSPEGTWSDATTLVTSLQYPGLYAPMMDPWSTGQDIRWNLSLWGSYNVVQMKTTLP